MRLRLSSLRQRLRRRPARRRPVTWPSAEPVVPALRGWPVEPPRR